MERIGHCGDGYEWVEQRYSREMIIVPIMVSDFQIERYLGYGRGVIGGNFWYMCRTKRAVMKAGRKALNAISQIEGVVAPFDVCSAGSKAETKFPQIGPTTNHPYCPSLKKRLGKESMVPEGVNYIPEIVVNGIALDKEVVHPGMPKVVREAKIALLNCPMEIEKTEFDAKLNIERPEQMKAFLDEETRLLKEMVEKVAAAGANVVVCQKGIDDAAQHFMAKKGILAVRRAKESDMQKLAKATGGRIVTNIDDLKPEDLGFAELVEERKLGEDKWTFLEGCRNPKAVTVLIRGGADKVVEEAERSIHDALCVVRDVVQKPAIVAGGGAPEIEASAKIRRWAEQLSGREQLAVQKFAEGLESIPSALAENAGLDPIDTLVALRANHEKGETWSGVDVLSRAPGDMFKAEVYEPLAVKEQIVKSATEAATTILRIDDVIAAGKPKEEAKKPPKPPGEEEGEKPGGLED
ncbi:MAG: thermosome subunit beta [Candidatus Bathyarchaeia archaeon]